MDELSGKLYRQQVIHSIPFLEPEDQGPAGNPHWKDGAVSAQQLKIMVVDDHAAFRGVVRAMLESAAWECVECEDGRDALQTYEAAMPDLVLMDLSMPGLDGMQATTQIKARFPAARIMILTQYDDPDLRAAAARAGACGYVLKENLLSLQTAIQAQSPATNNGSSGGARCP